MFYVFFSLLCPIIRTWCLYNVNLAVWITSKETIIFCVQTKQRYKILLWIKTQSHFYLYLYGNVIRIFIIIMCFFYCLCAIYSSVWIILSYYYVLCKWIFAQVYLFIISYRGLLLNVRLIVCIPVYSNHKYIFYRNLDVFLFYSFSTIHLLLYKLGIV